MLVEESMARLGGRIPEPLWVVECEVSEDRQEKVVVGSKLSSAYGINRW